jgi:hypothetical protein
MKEINKPNKKTWYICWNKDRKKRMVQNYIESNQVLKTPHEFLDTYTNRNKWRDVLIKDGMTEDEINEI